MRTYVAFFTYWADRADLSDKVSDEGESAVTHESYFAGENAPHFIAAAACAESESAALNKLRTLLLQLYKEDSRHELLPSGAAIQLSGLFDLTDLGEEAVILDWSTVRISEEGARFFPGIIRMSTKGIGKLLKSNPTEKPSNTGRMRREPFVIFPDLR